MRGLSSQLTPIDLLGERTEHVQVKPSKKKFYFKADP